MIRRTISSYMRIEDRPTAWLIREIIIILVLLTIMILLLVSGIRERLDRCDITDQNEWVIHRKWINGLTYFVEIRCPCRCRSNARMRIIQITLREYESARINMSYYQWRGRRSLR